MNSGFLKALVLIVVLVYIISPVDLCPGALDDIIVAVLGVAAHKRLSTN